MGDMISGHIYKYELPIWVSKSVSDYDDLHRVLGVSVDLTPLLDSAIVHFSKFSRERKGPPPHIGVG